MVEGRFVKLNMEVNKSQIINALFVLSFPFFGVGKYLAQVGNFSIGQTISVLPLLFIILFYLIDVLEKKEIKWDLKPSYFFVLLFSIFCVLAFCVAKMEGIPGLNSTNVFTLSLFVISIIHAPVILQFYNTENTTFSVQHLLYIGLSLDIGINLLGYMAGFSNAVHSIDGRLNLPFGQGFYATANTVAIINLLIVGKLFHGIDNPLVKTGLIAHFCFNMFLMILFNSRLSTLIFLLVILLVLTRLIYFQRSLLVISIFTLPLLLAFSELIYGVLKLPIFYKILKRVSYEGITGFNGRRDLWEKGLEWLYTYGKGFLWGNGYRGHYAIGLLDELERFWFKSSINMHMHSSMLEFSLSIGFIGILILFILMYKGVGFIQKQAILKHKDGILLGVFIYLLFLFQVDNYVYIINYGALVLFTLISPSLVTQKSCNHE